jgi:DNA-binding beta-propeller fold protein YncE
MFSTARRHKALAVSGALTVCALAACSSGVPLPASPTQSTGPERILAAPKNLRSAAEPQPNGTIWALAGDTATRALFEFNLTSGQRPIGATPVSNAAQSIAESLNGVIGIALGTHRSGALELLNGSTGTVTRTIPIGAPARQVVVGSDGNTFYVLNGTSASASVTIVDSQNGHIIGTVPVPLDTVSVVPDLQQATLYALEPSGMVSQIAVAGGRVMTDFTTGDSARSVALSPDGGTLYVLKGAAATPNVAVVDLATQSVRRVLPAPANCLQILVSANGSELYQMVGAPGYGNIQVFAS